MDESRFAPEPPGDCSAKVEPGTCESCQACPDDLPREPMATLQAEVTAELEHVRKSLASYREMGSYPDTVLILEGRESTLQGYHMLITQGLASDPAYIFDSAKRCRLFAQGEIQAHQLVEKLANRTSSGQLQVIRFLSNNPEYAWLSNFWPAPIALDGQTWPTVEHYYQAAKHVDTALYDAIRQAPTPGRAKRLGRTRRAPADWAQRGLEVMRKAVCAKFAQHPGLARKLVATGFATLVEDSPWDDYWGAGSDGKGQNWLGKILMSVRAELQV